MAEPAVGCVLVRDGRIVGRGWTQPGGRPHAETEALARAAAPARGATAYVTLEPCSHQGITGPCSAALIAAGIACAVVAIEDPDPRVHGQGIAALRAAGVDVATGATEAAGLNRGFLLRVSENRPLFTLKLATSLDGRIATRTGDSKWITGEDARRKAHLLRASHDAVLVGSGRAADDPALSCRLPGMAGRSPLRLVADARLRLPPTASVSPTARELPTWVLTAAAADPAKRAGAASCRHQHHRGRHRRRWQPRSAGDGAGAGRPRPHLGDDRRRRPTRRIASAPA
ncbi:MAG: bifunctional diaminohydroxyphosphoribosylaminopyrimidine deaminase/5-amino-6-(5-phosphoribosylamino)uracil reductase RibD [Rhodospirillales bacterium]